MLAYNYIYNITKRYRFRTRQWLARSELIYPLVGKNRHGKKFIHSKTELLFEGFYRCSNTFAYEAFLLSQENPVAVARHFHAPSQIAIAARERIPCILLIREPESTIASLIHYKPELTISDALFAYIQFYKAVKPHIVPRACSHVRTGNI